MGFSSFSGTCHLLIFTHEELAMKYLIVLYENVIKPLIWIFRLVFSFKSYAINFRVTKQKKFSFTPKIASWICSSVGILSVLACTNRHCKIFSATEFFYVLCAYPHQLPTECRLFQGLFLAKAHLCLQYIARY